MSLPWQAQSDLENQYELAQERKLDNRTKAAVENFTKSVRELNEAIRKLRVKAEIDYSLRHLARLCGEGK